MEENYMKINISYCPKVDVFVFGFINDHNQGNR